LKQREIAEMEGVDHAAVGSSIRLAKKKLRKLLAEEYQ
jgi:DNA-directed RNA polymerase specialized sigma24 family protein